MRWRLPLPGACSCYCCEVCGKMSLSLRVHFQPARGYLAGAARRVWTTVDPTCWWKFFACLTHCRRRISHILIGSLNSEACCQKREHYIVLRHSIFTVWPDLGRVEEAAVFGECEKHTLQEVGDAECHEIHHSGCSVYPCSLQCLIGVCDVDRPNF